MGLGCGVGLLVEQLAGWRYQKYSLVIIAVIK